ncbi:MAG: hypothetical protein J5733_07670 [Bacteroidaceae bacterium]|nr:hypothetical protein [Bacteroidaceae bacterium]
MLAVILCGLLGSCKSHKPLTTIVAQDSTRVEVKIETVYVPDTVFVEIPAQTAERTTADSTSHLENDYAKSDAAILPDGSLFHSLETKPQQKPVEFQKPVERKDSIVYREKEVPVPYPVTEYVEKKLSWWQQTEIYGFYALLLLLLVMLRKPIWKAAKYMLAFL